MARICCVETCRALPQEDITFFNFPIKQSLQKKWRDAIRPTEALTVESVICSRHFSEGDYETVRGKVRLKAKVVPTIFQRSGSPSSVENEEAEDSQNPKENGHSDSSNTKHTTHEDISEEEKTQKNEKEESVNNNCEDASKCDDGESDAAGGLEEDGLDDSREEDYGVPVELSCEVQLTEGDEKETIECVPEAILHEDSESHSEGDLHKEDIEDIIANYHIKQDPKLAERLKASQEKENQSNNQHSRREESVSDKECNKSDKVSNNSGKVSNNSGKESNNSGKGSKNSGKRDSLPPDKDDNDCVEVSYQPSRKRRKPEYIEISVDKDPTAKSNDCLMVMEKVQVDIDPSTLLFARAEEDSDVEETVPEESERKTEPISLLTSSDDDDVIIEEPHIDTVEVSDETDEDDLPLTRLVKADLGDTPKVSPKVSAKVSAKVGRILWGTLSEFYCYKCQYTTTSKKDFTNHQLEHEKIINVCEICQFSTASKSQFFRHKRKHKDGKIFSCHLCDYKAKHHMSLVYHLKSHGVDEKSARMTLNTDKSKCPKCGVHFTNIKGEFWKHYRLCEGVQSARSNTHKCAKCKFSARRPSELKRHVIKKHLKDRKSKRKGRGDGEGEGSEEGGSEDEDGDDDYEP